MTLVCAVVALLGLVPVASAARRPFTKPAKLTGPVGGEPSIATDPLGDVFVAGPQGVPSGAGGTAGIGFWSSRNDGSSFGRGRYIGSFLGGGDDDVIVSKGVVYAVDLEALAAEVCKSTDRGNTFDPVGPISDPTHCTTINTGQAAYSDDRPWLTADPSGRLYLTYHEFFSAQPLAFRSDNGGSDLFSHACGNLVSDPSIEANIPSDITGGTLVGRPVTDKAGNLYVLFTTTTQQQNAAALGAGEASGTFSQLYVAVSRDHCQSFTDHTVFDGSKLGTNTVQFGDIFNDLAIDGGGNLYTLGAGFIGHKPYASTANVYLFKSSDRGQKWQGPILIDSTRSAHMLPAAVGGPRAGQLAIGYFRTTNRVTDPGRPSAKWTYTTAESTNANSRRPSFTYRDVTPGYVYHRGDICNQGALCGPGEDRSLLDFTSVTLDAHNCPLFTFAANPQGSDKGTWNYVTRQQTGCFQSARRPSRKRPSRRGHRTAARHHARP
jgi:hypothetical protein